MAAASRLRAALNGAETPFFTGQAAWRALIPLESGAQPGAQVFMGAGRHLVSYPLAGGLRNIVAVEERRSWTAEGWSLPGDPAELRSAFAGFGGPVPGWLARVTECAVWGLHRHPAGSVPGEDGSAWLHVSAGLGTNPYVRFRVACRPEATLLTLVPSSPVTSPVTS